MLEISNSRRNIPKYSELESQGAGDLATARQPSRREVILLSLTIQFVLGGVGLFTCYAIKLTDQLTDTSRIRYESTLGIAGAPEPNEATREKEGRQSMIMESLDASATQEYALSLTGTFFGY
jgi:hypothetical protein